MDYVAIGFTVFQILMLIFWAYWLVISFFGFSKPRKLSERQPEKRFVILVPAHNEETVIGSLVENLINIDYPNKLYDVFVIADNCTDRTAEITRKFKGKVIEHTSPPNEPKGKPYAIRYALEQIGDRLTEDYDAVVVFDADNLVSSNYLSEMNKHFLSGDKIVQCYLDSKNPNDNWVTLSYSTSFYYANRFFQLAKSKLGLSNIIGGTGFCVDAQLLKKIGWTARSLTEDLEFTIQSILKGVSVNWCHTARVFDEKPESFIASCIQRIRWARGHWDVTFKYAPRLLKRAFLKGDLKSLDALLYLINPGKMVLASLTSMILYYDSTNNQSWIHSIFPWYLWFGFMIYYFVFVAYPMIVDIGEKRVGIIIRACLFVTFMFYSNIPLYFWAFFTVKNKTWRRTAHSKNIAIKNINLTREQVAASNEKR